MGLPHPVRSMTGEADGAEDVISLLQPLLLVRAERTATAAAEVRGRRREQTLADERHALRLARGLRRLDHIRCVRQLEEIRGQHRLDDDVLVGILRQRPVVVRQAICRRPCRASRSRESPARASAGSCPSSPRARVPASSAPSPSSVHIAWKLREEVVRRPRPSVAARGQRTCPASTRAGAAPCRATSRSDA